MLSLADETREFIKSALDFDHAVASLTVVGTTPEFLTATIAPGRKAPYELPMGSGKRLVPSPTFSREVLVELVVRMQKRRWLRFDDFVLGMSPPNEADWDQIKAILGTAPEHGDGWYDLVLATAHWIVELGGDPRAGQLKEKYGTLHWYGEGVADARGYEIIDAAEHLSEFVCEACGAPGGNTRSGWMKTRCEEHDDA